MTQPFLKAYAELLIQTCHRRGAHAMGGMAAQIPISGDAAANERGAGARARRQAARGQRRPRRHLGGASGADPGGAARSSTSACRARTSATSLREDVQVDARGPAARRRCGTITRAGFENNVEVCVRYLAAWLDGNGCVPIHHLMEDAATAEIARAQLWQWLHFADAGGRRCRWTTARRSTSRCSSAR